MENFFARYKNPLVLMAVLFIQFVALATQVRRPDGNKPSSSGSTRLIRVWTVTAITPFERALVATGHFFRSTWRDYIGLHDVRKQNLALQQEVVRLRLQEARLQASADESQRLRALLDFKERYVGETVAAQIIGTSGSDSLRTVTIDKGSHDGIQPDMAVITPDGIVGKIREVFPLSSVVLMINDRESGAGVILQNSRLHGILRGVGPGELMIRDVMSDEKVDVGEPVVTSGGDRVYPKGLAVGSVIHVGNATELGPFLAIKIKPAANLDRLEDVLVITKIAAEAPVVTGDTHRTAEILAQRLPSVPKKETSGNSPAVPAGNAGEGPAATNKDRAGTGSPQATPGGTRAKNAPSGTPLANTLGGTPAKNTPNGAPLTNTLSGTPAKNTPSGAPLTNTLSGTPAKNTSGAPLTNTLGGTPAKNTPSSTPAKKKPLATPSPSSKPQAPTATPPVEPSQSDSVAKPKSQPSPATGEKPPR